MALDEPAGRSCFPSGYSAYMLAIVIGVSRSTHEACAQPMKHASGMLSSHEACDRPTVMVCSTRIRIATQETSTPTRRPARRRPALPRSRPCARCAQQPVLNSQSSILHSNQVCRRSGMQLASQSSAASCSSVEQSVHPVVMHRSLVCHEYVLPGAHRAGKLGLGV